MTLLVDALKGYKIILASSSPRRKQLLSGLDIDFTIENNCGVSEEYDNNEIPEKIPETLSIRKSMGFGRELHPEEIIITADTLVICDGVILGKPADKNESLTMLRMLSGKSHKVISAVTLRSINKTITFSAQTTVYFKILSEKEINYYIDNYKPFDKAGSYGAQDWIGYTAIKKIEGSYYNVIGMPVEELSEKLIEFVSS